jgi:hypothetical protein
VHIYLATLGHTPLAHFKPMWNGWEEESAEDGRPGPEEKDMSTKNVKSTQGAIS